MQQSVQQMRAEMGELNRAATHLLNEKGSRAWSALDQLTFDTLVDRAEGIGEQIGRMTAVDHVTAQIKATQRRGVEIYFRKGDNAKTLSAEELACVRNAMSTTTPSEGGYAVGSIVAQDVVSLLKSYGAMRQVATPWVTTSGASAAIPTSDGTAEVGEQLAENAAAGSADPTFASVAIPAYKFSSRVFTVPIELLQDSEVDIVAFVLGRGRERVGRIQNQRFTTGTGSSQPTGLVTAATVGKTGLTGQTATVIYDDLADLVDSVDAAHTDGPDDSALLPTAKPGWMMSQAMRKVVRKLKDTNGRPIWTPGHSDNAGRKVLPQLLDHAVYINNDVPAPAANAKSLLFGNLASYTVRDVLDVRVLRLEDSAFALKGQVGFLMVARAGGNLADSGAVKAYQHPAT